MIRVEWEEGTGGLTYSVVYGSARLDEDGWFHIFNEAGELLLTLNSRFVIRLIPL